MHPVEPSRADQFRERQQRAPFLQFSLTPPDGHLHLAQRLTIQVLGPPDHQRSIVCLRHSWLGSSRRDQAPTMPHRRHFDVRRRKKEPAKDSWTNQVIALAIRNVWLGLASRQNHYTQGTSESAIPPVP